MKCVIYITLIVLLHTFSHTFGQNISTVNAAGNSNSVSVILNISSDNAVADMATERQGELAANVVEQLLVDSRIHVYLDSHYLESEKKRFPTLLADLQPGIEPPWDKLYSALNPERKERWTVKETPWSWFVSGSCDIKRVHLASGTQKSAIKLSIRLNWNSQDYRNKYGTLTRWKCDGEIMAQDYTGKQTSRRVQTASWPSTFDAFGKSPESNSKKLVLQAIYDMIRAIDPSLKLMEYL